ncbi:hypothetical protein F5X99DRAFT_394947 [Biscogniauxia marginata]|nr:hypothetical protein F5X99DRAFT_394947 [Biscogniauxia marginata]
MHCQVYSSLRCHMLHERLGQVKFSPGSRQLGRRKPNRAPEEWHLADLGWRQWLPTRLTIPLYRRLSYPMDPENDVLWRIWSPLAHILTSVLGSAAFKPFINDAVHKNVTTLKNLNFW